MKLAKNLLNILLFIITFVIIILAQYGVTALLTLQAGDDADRVQFKADETEVSYFDSPVFFVEDLKVGFQQEDYWLVRGWVKNDTWVKCTGWIDTTISKIAVFGKALITPVIDIRDMRDKHIDGYEQSWNKFGEGWYKILTSEEFMKEVEKMDEVEKAKYNVAILQLMENGSISEEQWKSENPELYKYIRIAAHYNEPAMQKFYLKFIDQNTKAIKFSAITVYIHYIIAFILAIWFVHNNKFKIRRDEIDGSNVVEGGYTGFSKKKKKNKKQKKFIED